MTTTAKELVAKTTGIFALPEVYSTFNRKLGEANATNAQLAEIIQMDAGLAASLLKLVNSSFYGFPSTISSISQAISIIGRKELAILVVGHSVIKAFSDIQVDAKIINEHWLHSLSCGLIAKQITRMSAAEDISAETLFVAGLIHDIGKLVIWAELPEVAVDISQKIEETGCSSIVSENNLLGFTHAEVGAELIQSWNLPDILYQTSLHHHADDSSGQDRPVEIVIVSNLLAHAAEAGEAQSDENMIDSAWLEKVELTAESLEEIVAITGEQLKEISSIFLKN